MSKPVTIPNIFANQVGPIPLSQLDSDLAVGATALNDFLTYTNGVTDTGVVNALVITILAPLTFAYTLFVALDVQVSNTTTSTAPTVNVNSLGAKTITQIDGAALATGALVSGGIYRLIYDGTNFRVMGGSVAGLANPTASIGLTAVNGTATTAIRSDGAPALSQAIAPTWTGTHIFNGTVSTATATTQTSIGIAGTAASVNMYSAGAALNQKAWDIRALTGGTLDFRSVNDAFGSASDWLLVSKGAGAAVGSIAFGNATDNPTYSFLGTGSVTATGQFVSKEATTAGYGLFTAADTTGSRVIQLVSVGSTAATAYGITAGNAGIDTAAGVSMTLSTADTARVVISAAGNVTINAPTSGAALSIVPLAGQYAQVINATLGNLSYIGLCGNANVAGTSDFLVGQDASSIGLLFNRANAAVNIGTNGAVRMIVSSVGSVTINAPASGVGLLVNGLTANQTIQISSTGAASSLGVGWNVGITSNAWNIFSQSTDPITLGCAGGAALTLVTNNINRFQIASAGAISGFGTTAAGLVDMSPDTGTFTASATGMTAGVSYSCTWTRHGKLVTLAIGGSTGTSNSTSFTMTGLPAAIQPASVTPRIQMNGAIMQDNGATVGTSAITEASLAASSGTITFLKGGLSTGWTAANSKGIPTGATAVFSYLLN